MPFKTQIYLKHTSQADTQKNSFTAHLIRQYSGMIWKFYPILAKSYIDAMLGCDKEDS